MFENEHPDKVAETSRNDRICRQGHVDICRGEDDPDLGPKTLNDVFLSRSADKPCKDTDAYCCDQPCWDQGLKNVIEISLKSIPDPKQHIPQ